MKIEKLNKFGISNIELNSFMGGANQTATVCTDYTYNKDNHLTDGEITTSDDNGNVTATRSVKY